MNDSNEVSHLKPEKDNKIRTYQNGEIVLDSEDFETLLDVFRTLLKWSKDLERSTK